MQVVQRVIYSHVVPVARLWSRLGEVAILAENEVRVKQSSEFFFVLRIERVVCAVAFCNDDSRAVKSFKSNDDPLVECAFRVVFAVHVLLYVDDVLFVVTC